MLLRKQVEGAMPVGILAVEWGGWIPDSTGFWSMASMRSTSGTHDRVPGFLWGRTDDGIVPGAGPHVTLCPTFPGSLWWARNPPWCRRPWGSWCGSSAPRTAPRAPTPGGRKTGGPSPLTGGCSQPAAPPGPSNSQGWGVRAGSGEPGLLLRRDTALKPPARPQAPAAVRRLPGHQPPEGGGRGHLQLWRPWAGPPLSAGSASRHRSRPNPTMSCGFFSAPG